MALMRCGEDLLREPGGEGGRVSAGVALAAGRGT